MKSVFLSFGLAALFVSSCTALKNSGTVQDDLYLDPKKDRQAFYTDTKQTNAVEQVTIQPVNKQQEETNPYYKEKDFNYDDYYDNEYASRLKRFHNPTYGLGYYDSFYTNSYFYTQNPAMYNMSIYNSYNYMYNPGFNYGWGNGIGLGMGMGTMGLYSGWGMNPVAYNNWGYNNWGYNNSVYNPYTGYNPYYGYPYGWGNSFNNGFYGSYFNPFDANSNTYYGPRMNHGGYNSNRPVIGSDNGKSVLPFLATNEMASADPTSTERFNHVLVPSENINLIKEQKALTLADPNYIPRPLNTNLENSIVRPVANSTFDSKPVLNETGTNKPIRHSKNDVKPRTIETPVIQNANPVKNAIQQQEPRTNWNFNPPKEERPSRGNTDFYSPRENTQNNGSFDSPSRGGTQRGGQLRPR